MCGHSLGPMPSSAKAVMNETLHDWECYGVLAWNKRDWITLPSVLATKLALLMGADADEVMVGDSTTVNLFKVLNSALKMQPGRSVILTTTDNFPSDLYVAEGIASFRPDVSLRTVASDEIVDHLDERVAVLMLTHVNYRDSSLLDMKRINEAAHALGILTVWDLSHSIGILPLRLRESAVDFAVGCTYKYLSGGPGSPAFIYVNRCHHHRVSSPIYGWMGHDRPFDFSSHYAASGVPSFLGGTPAVLSMTALAVALELFDAELLPMLYHQALAYGSLLIAALEALSMEVVTPLSHGGHVAFRHHNGYGISRALIDLGVIGDYRSPSLVRLCVNPLYLSLADITVCIERLNEVITKRLYLNSSYRSQERVT